MLCSNIEWIYTFPHSAALSPVELADKLDLKEALKRRRWFMQPCSAKLGEGLMEGFAWITVNLWAAISLCATINFTSNYVFNHMTYFLTVWIPHKQYWQGIVNTRLICFCCCCSFTLHLMISMFDTSAVRGRLPTAPELATRPLSNMPASSMLVSLSYGQWPVLCDQRTCSHGAYIQPWTGEDT